MNFSFVPSSEVIVSAAAAFVAMAFIIIFFCGRLRRVVRKAEDDGKRAETAAEDLPDVSVVVYAYDDADYLARLLPRLLSQEYAAPFEVIVVNEGQSDATSEVVNMLALKHQNLYLTFTPEGARNLSRKKLALTLGVKAARYDVILTVDADTGIDSDRWLARMAGHFSNPRCGVVLGACRRDERDDDSRGSTFRMFDSFTDTVTWLSAAIAGHPYRGTSHNLGYRRKLFFDNKGFSRSLNLRYGDDDIFVSEIARGDNTEVELSPESITEALSYNPRRAYREQKQRSLFTGRMVRRGSRRLTGACTLAFWIWLAGVVMMTVAGLPSLLPACVALASAAGVWIPAIIYHRKAMTALGYTPLGWSLPWYIYTRPLHTLSARLRARREKIHNYTWG